MIILSASVVLSKDPATTSVKPGEKIGNETGKPLTAPAQSDIDDLSVKAGGDRKESQKNLHEGVGPKTVKVQEAGGHTGFRAFLLKIAGTMLKDPAETTMYRSGKHLSPKSDPNQFVAKRDASGAITLTVDGDPDKLLKRFRGFAIVNAERNKVLSQGIVEGNTITFPDSKNIPGDARIVRIYQGVIGSALSSLGNRAFGSRVVESLGYRSQWSTVSEALQAGKRHEAAAEKAALGKNSGSATTTA